MKALFFSPFANIWEHSFPEALVAESFASRGLEVSTVRCGTMLADWCVAMSAAGLGPDAPADQRLAVCRACVRRRDFIDTSFGFGWEVLDEWVQPADRARADGILATVEPTTWTALEVDGIPLGRYAGYELWLAHKLVDAALSGRVWDQYRQQLRNVLLVYFAGTRLLEAHRPDAVLVYNEHYGVHHAFCAAAERLGIPAFTMQGGNHIVRRGETIALRSAGVRQRDILASAAWTRYAQQPVGASEVSLVGEHIQGLLAGSSAWAYSAPLEGSQPAALRERFGIPQDATVLLAAMSSEDELLAARLIGAIPEASTDGLFADQLAWVRYLRDYAAGHPDVHILLRLHPRMFPNKRESVLAPVVAKIMALREGAPPNLHFNLPEDGVGLYDLAQLVDVLLNFRSSVGAEFAAFGIPVVSPRNPDFDTYPDQVHAVGSTLDEYGALIDTAIAEGWSMERSVPAVRWYAFQFTRLAVAFAGAVAVRPIAARPRKPGWRLRWWNRMVFFVVTRGPLVRERLAMRGRRIAHETGDLLLDTVRGTLPTSADSALWPAPTATEGEERAAIAGWLRSLADGPWAQITEPRSLAARIREATR